MWCVASRLAVDGFDSRRGTWVATDAGLVTLIRPQTTMATTEEADDGNGDVAETFEWTDRTSFYLLPAYAVDPHTGLAMSEKFEVIADDLEEAKQFVLGWSGRDEVLGWIEIREHDHDKGIPARRESGVVRISEEEYREMRRETERDESACWVCGPFKGDRMDHENAWGLCPDCGMTTSASRLLEKDGTELLDGTNFIKKSTMNLNSPNVGDGTAEEIIDDLLEDA